jgi:hypothetical protein
MKLFNTNLLAAFGLAIAVSAAPVAAQGKSGSHGGGAGKGHTEHATVQTKGSSGSHGNAHVQTRTSTGTRHATTTRTTPPGWCQGRGNPHNTAANCGYRTDRIYRDRNGVWRDRYGNRLRTGYVYRDRSGVVRDFLGRLLR